MIAILGPALSFLIMVFIIVFDSQRSNWDFYLEITAATVNFLVLVVYLTKILTRK